MTEATTPDSFDPQFLLALSQRTDPVGVLSIYVDAEHGSDPGLHGAAIDIKNRLGELQRRIEEEGPPERTRRLAEGIDRFAPEIERLTSPLEHGRGRVLFLALGDERVTRVSSQLPVPSRVVLDSNAFIHPLLELLDRGRPAGVVLGSREEAKLLEWRLGELRLLDRLVPEVGEAPHERSGPVGPTPTDRQGSPKREQREARQREQSSRFLEQVAATASRVAGERDWDNVLVSGGERLTEPLAGALAPPLRDVAIRDPRLLLQLDADSLTDTVTERLNAARDEFESQLIRRAADAAAGSGQAALGLSQVVGALNEARVAHLLYDSAIRYQGWVGDDGRLHADDETGPAEGALVREPRLTERLVERALETGARITPLEGTASEDLGEVGGIAALLRW